MRAGAVCCRRRHFDYKTGPRISRITLIRWQRSETTDQHSALIADHCSLLPGAPGPVPGRQRGEPQIARMNADTGIVPHLFIYPVQGVDPVRAGVVTALSFSCSRPACNGGLKTGPRISRITLIRGRQLETNPIAPGSNESRRAGTDSSQMTTG